MPEPESPWLELLGRLRQQSRDDPAWHAAWREAWQRLEDYARGVLRLEPGEASAGTEDLVQEVVLKLLASPGGLERLDPSLNPEAYLKASIRNKAHDLARRKVLAVKALQRLAQTRLTAELSGRELEGTTAALLEELEKLPPEQRQLLRMRYWEGLPVGEIALRLGEPYSRVAVRLFRLLKQLKQRLARQNDSSM